MVLTRFERFAILRYDMWDVCVSTPLNRRHAGESVTIENMEAKMAETLKPRACDEVEALDTGEIPGDHKGIVSYLLYERPYSALESLLSSYPNRQAENVTGQIRTTYHHDSSAH